MNAIDVLKASDLFESNSDIIRSTKQKGVRINGQVVEDLNEPIELGDFLNFVWFHNAVQMMAEHGPVFLVVAKGKKQRALLKLNGSQLEIVY